MSRLSAVLALSVFACSLASAQLNVPTENLVAWYKLDGTADDSIEPAANGQLSKGKWIEHGGLALSGNGQVHIGNVPKLTFRSGFTLCARVRTKEGRFGQVVGSNGSGGLVVSINEIKFASWGADWIVDAYLPEDEWVHVAVAVDEQGEGRMYANGAEIVRLRRIQPWPKDPDDWTIGGWAVGEGFRGSLADVMIWNTALSAKEVKHLATYLGLGSPITVPHDEPAPISKTPKSVREIARTLEGLALEPELLPRYPFSAMMGEKRFDQALRLRTHAERAREEKWLADLVPTFDCPDERWTRCWYYRWFLVRANYQEENGVPGFYEGKRGGFTRHITYSVPHIMDEVRWLRDRKYAYGQAEIVGKRREPNGRRFGGYTHWISHTLWNTYLVLSLIHI